MRRFALVTFAAALSFTILPPVLGELASEHFSYATHAQSSSVSYNSSHSNVKLIARPGNKNGSNPKKIDQKSSNKISNKKQNAK